MCSVLLMQRGQISLFNDWIYETQKVIFVCIIRYYQNFLDLDYGDDDLDEEGKVGLVASSLALTDKNNTTRQLCRRHLFSSSSMSWWPDLLVSLSTIAMISLMFKFKVIRQVLRELPIEDIYVRAE